MRQICESIINAQDATVNQTSSKLDSGQLVNASFHAFFTANDAVGTLVIQASNDPVPNGSQRNQFTPTNWVDVPNTSTAVATGTSKLILISNIAYSWLRVKWTPSGGSAGTVTVNVDSIGV